MKKTLPVKLPGGARMNYGQIVSPNIARDGAPKRTHTAEPATPMKYRDEADHPLAFVGGKRPLDDEPMQKTFLNGKSEPRHPSMITNTRAWRGIDKGQDHGSAILQEAGRLGKQKGTT